MKRIIHAGWFLFLTFCLFDAAAQPGNPAYKPAYPKGKMPPKSDSDHVWLHIDGTYIKRSPTCTKRNEIWQGCGVNPTCNMKYNPELIEWISSFEGVNWMRQSWFNHRPWGHPEFVPEEWKTFQDIFDNFIKPVVAKNKQEKIYTLVSAHMAPPWYDTNKTPPYQESDVEEWIGWWKQISAYFKDEPWVMGYEILNEPQNTQQPTALLREWVQRCVKAIRENDTNHIIVVPSVLSGCLYGNYFLWETYGTSWMVEGELPMEERYDFGDAYNQTAIRYHSYMDSYFLDGTDPPRHATAYEALKYCGNLNLHLKRYREEFNLCIINTEMGYWGGPEEWWIEGHWGVPKAKYWNWHRWYMMQSIEMQVGDREFWKDGPKAHYYSGTISRGSEFWMDNVYFESCEGEEFEIAPEPYPPCDTCLPHGDHNAWSWHAVPWTFGRESWEFWTRWVDLWSWAAKKAGSRPPERHSDPYGQIGTDYMPDNRERAGKGAAYYSDGVLYLSGSTAGNVAHTILLYETSGRLVFSAGTAANKMALPCLRRGAYILVVGDRNSTRGERILIR